MATNPKKVMVRVPATTANMGPGFDCIGMALDLWNELTVEISDKFEMTIEGEGATQIPKDRTNLVVEGVEKAYELAGKPLPLLKYTCVNMIPFARGLGSSSAAIVSGLIAGLALTGHHLKVEGVEAFLNLASDIEGHPDNSAPCIYGGMQLGLYNEEEKRWCTERIPIPAGLQLVLFVPDKMSETKATRALLKDTIPRKDAIFNMSRTALLVSAFYSGDMSRLRLATQDRLHQPPRATAYPELYPIIQAALDAGAHGAFLSGAGSTIMAITSGRKGDAFAQDKAERNELEVGEAMRATAAKLKLP
eukprot:Ihof_evm2s88 gene=Ihof_evmTU2s88